MESKKKKTLTPTQKLVKNERERNRKRVQMEYTQNLKLTNIDLENKVKELEYSLKQTKQALDQSIKQLEFANNKLTHLQLELDYSNHVLLPIFNNTKHLISSLPHNSPYRRPLLYWFTKNLSIEDAMATYLISKRTYNRIIEEEDSEVVSHKYAIDVKRERITEEQKEEIKRILDDILPKQSGRDYCYQEITDKHTFF